MGLKYMTADLKAPNLLGEISLAQADDNSNIKEGSFLEAFKNIWADNGDYISKIYTGTGATTSSTTRKGKGGIVGLIDHKMKSLGRFFLGNFEDNHKQKAINILLGKNFEGQFANEILEQELEKVEDEFVVRQRINIAVLTWCAHLDIGQITPELIRNLFAEIDLMEVDILQIGLQNAVKSGGFKLFGSDIKDVVAKYEQVLIAFFKSRDITLKKFSVQGQGERAIFTFVKERHFQNCGRDNVDFVKFGGGMMGVLGGKSYGAIVQRFNFRDSTLCFINAHLTSGKDNVQERAVEIQRIYKEAFQKDKFGQVQEDTIDNSDLIFLFGNLNFRLNIPDSTARISCDQMDAKLTSDWSDQEIRKIREILEADEFTNTPLQNDLLSDFIEGPIGFGPTFKLHQISPFV